MRGLLSKTPACERVTSEVREMNRVFKVVLNDRLQRLCARTVQTDKPIVWLRATAGAGKTRLLQSLLQGPGAKKRSQWRIIDGEQHEELADELAKQMGLNGGRKAGVKLIVATRPRGPAEPLFAAPGAYGLLEKIGDDEFFLSEKECRASGVSDLYEQTGGWPVLVDAFLEGRAQSVREVLPNLLEREVLPYLPQWAVTTLLAAACEPLSSSTCAQLSRGEPLHPLLKQQSDRIVTASAWVCEALEKLIGRPSIAQSTAMEELNTAYAGTSNPVPAIHALLKIGRKTQALDVFERAGGIYFGYNHGFQALESVLQSGGPQWWSQRESSTFAYLWLLMKKGRGREARQQLEASYPGLSVDLRGDHPIASPYASLLAIVIASDVANTPTPETITSWSRLASLFPPADDMARGLLYNTMAIALVQGGVLGQAEELARESLSAYQRAGSAYLVHCMLLHLADLAIRNSRMREASTHLHAAEQALSASTHAFNTEHLIIGAFKARIAYEEGRFEDCPPEVEPILRSLMDGDSWPDLIANTARYAVFSAFWKKGLANAVDILERCSLALNRRHGAPLGHHFALIRIRLWQVARRHGQADAALQQSEAALPADRSPQLDHELNLIRLRQKIIRQRDLDSATTSINALVKNPYLSARQRITLSILQANIRLSAGKDGEARRHLTVALRTAQAEHLIGVLYEESQFLERLLPLYLREPHLGTTGLRSFARQIQRRLQTLPSAPNLAKQLAGVSRQEHQVLSHLSDGNTNKEIARALGLSQSTVKFHLRSLFRKLRVASRLELLQTAHERGIVT
jgi:DNA-binding NarL/FixJ family response regulator